MKNTVFTFKRYEKKYLMTAEQFEALWQALAPHVRPDEYGHSVVCSVYYDTEDFALIRHSLDKPVYKEKLRVRSYGVPDAEGTVFVELKKKFKGVVYKRRIQMTAADAERWLAGEQPPPADDQISREIAWFLRVNAVRPRVFIGCDRDAFVARDDPDLRFTFDRNLRWRDRELSLTDGAAGEPLLDGDMVLMEIKLPGAAPLWLAGILNGLRLYPVSFSKYGSCFKTRLFEKYFDGVMAIA